MAFGKRSSPSVAAAPSEAEARAAALAERKETLERRREAIRSEADALRKAIDSTAERGEDASADAAALVDADRRLAAISLELTAAGKALDAARAVVAAIRAGTFWPPAILPLDRDDFAWLFAGDPPLIAEPDR